MAIDKLTKADRAQAQPGMGCDSNQVLRFIRIIDALTGTLAESQKLIDWHTQEDSFLRQQLAELRVECERLRADKADERRIAGEAWVRIRELELRAYDLGVANDALEAKLSAAETDCERLRDDSSTRLAYSEQWCTEALALRDKLATAEALLREWSNFDFDCPDEYDRETDGEGDALDRLYERTGEFFRATSVKPGEHPSEPSYETQRAMVEYWRTACNAAESKLAAAEALLKRVSADWDRSDPWAKDVAVHLASALSETCAVPPPGWACRRAAGHDGPCAAHPVQPAARHVQASGGRKIGPREVRSAVSVYVQGRPQYLERPLREWIDKIDVEMTADGGAIVRVAEARHSMP